jgi:hypothetical protein
LWFNGCETLQPCPSQQNDNVITLSEEFYREIEIPVERAAVAALANAPGALDFYVWLVNLDGQRTARPHSLFGLDGLCEQLGTQAYSDERYFRRKIIRWLRQVKALWPECPASLSSDGQLLIVASSNHSSAILRHTDVL